MSLPARRYRHEVAGDSSLEVTGFPLESPPDLMLAHWESVHPELAVVLAGMPIQTLKELRQEALDNAGEKEEESFDEGGGGANL